MNTADARDMDRTGSTDVLVVGGGLAGGLTALALSARGLSVRVVEGASELGGNHTWSFHATDVPASAWPLVDPLIAYRWDGHRVRFPNGERRMEGGYFSITSRQFADVVSRRLAEAGNAVLLGTTVRACRAREIELADGTRFAARLVLDARGATPADRSVGRAGVAHAAERDGGASARGCGYQKFVGLEVELISDHELSEPMLMDATVAQVDGFRFVYVLPLAPRRLLVEDTVYSNDVALDRDAFRARVLTYIAEQGHGVGSIVREESGVLPLPWKASSHGPFAGRREANGNEGRASRVPDVPLAVGYRGGWFHPVTGYSVPVALRLAVALAQAAPAGAHAMWAAAERVWRMQEAAVRFGHLLNRLMFTAVEPAHRWRLLARFYRLPTATIERFYALRTTTGDHLRLLAGWPPRGLSWRSVLFSKEDR